MGHILSIGGVCGEVVSKNERMVDPTVVEWLGRLADEGGAPLHLRDFRDLGPTAARAATSNRPLARRVDQAGKTTTAAQLIRSLASAGHKVSAAKITGTACRKDPSLLEDAGATRVLDFTWTGWPSTAGCSREELLSGLARDHLGAAGRRAGGPGLRDRRRDRSARDADAARGRRGARSVDAVTYAAPDSLSCESGVRMLRGLGYKVLATAGPVANSGLGRAEVEA